jgi:protein O-GlcNAc transferase
VAGSLLRTMGLFELVTTSLEDYERQARALAEHPEVLGELKARVRERRRTSPLFDAARFARHLETAYRAMWDRHTRGEAPHALSVAPEEPASSGAAAQDSVPTLRAITSMQAR